MLLEEYDTIQFTTIVLIFVQDSFFIIEDFVLAKNRKLNNILNNYYPFLFYLIINKIAQKKFKVLL